MTLSQELNNGQRCAVKPFDWQDWPALWALRTYQLYEGGIGDGTVDVPEKPDLNSPYEKDYHRIDQVYLRGKGNFWIARLEGMPAGHIAAEDRGAAIELRRMYVRPEYRRRGIASLLVRALIEYCTEREADRIELWTAIEGPGRFLYERFGFREVEGVSDDLYDVAEGRQIRMRLILKVR